MHVWNKLAMAFFRVLASKFIQRWEAAVINDEICRSILKNKQRGHIYMQCPLPFLFNLVDPFRLNDMPTVRTYYLAKPPPASFTPMSHTWMVGTCCGIEGCARWTNITVGPTMLGYTKTMFNDLQHRQEQHANGKHGVQVHVPWHVHAWVDGSEIVYDAGAPQPNPEPNPEPWVPPPLPEWAFAASPKGKGKLQTMPHSPSRSPTRVEGKGGGGGGGGGGRGRGGGGSGHHADPHGVHARVHGGGGQGRNRDYDRSRSRSRTQNRDWDYSRRRN
jgi:uncharacterized membrane protein YgcG